MSEVRRILILCGDADGNLGDRAILRAMCRTFAQAAEGVALAVTSSHPQRARQEFGAEALPAGWRNWWALWQAAGASDLVICGGGGLFQDDDSLVKMPYWALRVLLARLRCGRVAGVSLGVGPLRARVSRFFARVALNGLHPVSVRDPLAQQLAQRITRRTVELVPDPALLLEPAPPQQAEEVLAAHGVPMDGRPLIGVAPRRWFPPRARIIPHSLAWRWRGTPASEQRGNQELARLLAQVLDCLVEQQDGYIVFLPSYNKPHEADDRVCQAVMAAMRSNAHALLRMDDPALYKAVTGRMSLMLGGRMHPTIFAAACGTPVVGLAYNPKFHGLFQMLGLADQVVDVTDFVAQRRVEDVCLLARKVMGRSPDLATRAAELAQRSRCFMQRLVREN